ncbi:MAG: glutamine synthetase III [Opitutales bacterium]|nr:glutamine synthetase III [Opitutales bacterium]
MNSRKTAIAAIAATQTPETPTNPNFVEEFGCDVFGLKTMSEYLPKPVFKKLRETMETGKALDSSIADDVAHAMKTWAIERGATHYTHWFMPLTGATAEKHDSFLEPAENGKVIARFSGKNLIIGEPDASSFPSGGLRSTAEARGYTAWDPSSPAFIKRENGVATLYIPTAFCSYTGEVLDKKTPLLRSMQVLGAQAKRLLKCFGKDFEAGAKVTLGAEQEYFLIDKRFYVQRPDLMQTGRTLFGAPPQRHQQLEDHYFGAIKPRILSFMSELDRELWRLGIPAKTRHNEVAPAQFEVAPIFEEVNLAVDHNMLIMDALTRIADKHGLACLLHEKPFAGVNGAGKHNNWSISVGDINLLNPGKDPHQNAIFLTSLCAVIEAVDRHADLLRSAIAGAGNDHRLGANEAPPAIISMYLGEQLADIVSQIEKGEAKSSKQGKTLKIGADILPELPCDATDRNRTSPFAFTGNKFEFRAAGSSQSCASPNIVLNTAVAEAFDEIATHLENLPKNADFHAELQKLLSSIIKKHKKIIFNGNNYGEEWKKEAAKRGLPNLRTTPEAIKPLIKPENIALFEKYGVFNRVEMQSRYEIFLEEYERKIGIEAGLALKLARTHIIPAVAAYLERLGKTIEAEKLAGVKKSKLASYAQKISARLNGLIEVSEKLDLQISKAEKQQKILETMAELRKIADAAEGEVDNELWTLPKYCEMLFVY